MDRDVVVWGALVALLLALLAVTLGGLVWAVRDRRRTRLESSAARAEAEALRARVDALAAEVRRRPEPTGGTWTITDVGESGTPGDPAGSPGRSVQRATDTRIDGRLFADLVLRETVVRAASLAHGLRRGLAPETRNRIRFEMRRELKRARRQRRADLKALRRQRDARRRDAVDEDDAA